MVPTGLRKSGGFAPEVSAASDFLGTANRKPREFINSGRSYPYPTP